MSPKKVIKKKIKIRLNLNLKNKACVDQWQSQKINYFLFLFETIPSPLLQDNLLVSKSVKSAAIVVSSNMLLQY